MEDITGNNTPSEPTINNVPQPIISPDITPPTTPNNSYIPPPQPANPMDNFNPQPVVNTVMEPTVPQPNPMASMPQSNFNMPTNNS